MRDAADDALPLLALALGVVAVAWWASSRPASIDDDPWASEPEPFDENPAPTPIEVIEDMSAAAGNAVTGLIRGIRNRNPGNIRRSADQWQGMSATQSDPAFVQFESFAYGLRAMAVILVRSYAPRGLNTVAGIVDAWAPSVENDTQSYIRSVADRLGVNALDPLDLTDPVTLKALLRAIARHENGFVAESVIPENAYDQGIAMALGVA